MNRWTAPMLIAVLLTSGCLDLGTDPPDQDDLPTLADVAECRGWAGEDGGYPSCENEITRLSYEDSESGFGWLCMDEGGFSTEHRVQLWWNPNEDERGFWYQVPQSELQGAPVSGIVAYRETGDDEWVFASWNHASHEEFQVIPDLPPKGDLRISFWSTPYQTNTSALQGGIFSVNWSIQEGEAVPVRVLETNDTAYYFPHNVRIEGSEHPAPYIWAGKWPIEGSDFELEISFVKLINAQFDYVLDATGPKPCILDSSTPPHAGNPTAMD